MAQDYEVQEYQFQSFTKNADNSGSVSDFQFQNLDSHFANSRKPSPEIIKVERTNSRLKGFEVSDIVRHHRGLQAQEESEKEQIIQEEVERRLALIKEDAFRQGFQEGSSAGKEEVFQETIRQTEEKLETLGEMIRGVLGTSEDILKAQKKQIYNLVRTLTKWVILRELKDDDKYLERLLEKIILEMQTKKNLLVRVDQKDFEFMPEVLEHVQKRIGELQNVRVEIDFDIEGPGLVLESENGIINGTLNEQLKSLDRLFETVGLGADESESE